MVKYLAMAAVLVAPLMLANMALARGPHGCATCGGGYGGGYVVSGGCPGGMCSVPVAAPSKMAVSYSAVPVVAAQPASVPVATATAPAPRYYTSNTGRRGLFGWRR